ncbi:MAG: nucleoside triphosphate pyrophosphohydrolase [Syntrophales bacterium]|nr:nucleoside triphosphate pyrophosphohydrolase [Syntrophales bacterium]
MKDQTEHSVHRITGIIDRLRGPNGCPWDRRQKREDVGRYLLEEVYEVIDAIEQASPNGLKEELGDVLFQILFLAKMAEEAGDFTLSDIVAGISEKMILRHPHVFENAQTLDVEEVRANWQRIKNRERGKGENEVSPIDALPRSMPPLMAAHKITGRAAKKGFDWKDTAGVVEKIGEELAELREAVSEGKKDRIEGEIGDMFLSLVNLCRFVQTNPEDALRSSLRKFTARFSFIEESLKKKGLSPLEATMEEMDCLWNMAKEIERDG